MTNLSVHSNHPGYATCPGILNLFYIPGDFKGTRKAYAQAKEIGDREGKQDAAIRIAAMPFGLGSAVCTIAQVAKSVHDRYFGIIGAPLHPINIASSAFGIVYATIAGIWEGLGLKRAVMMLKRLTPSPIASLERIRARYLDNPTPEKQAKLQRRVQPWLAKEIEKTLPQILADNDVKAAKALVAKIRMQLVKKAIVHIIGIMALVTAVAFCIFTLLIAPPTAPIVALALTYGYCYLRYILDRGYLQSQDWSFDWKKATPHVVYRVANIIHAIWKACVRTVLTPALKPNGNGQADVVSVGGGPVGLWQALQIKILKPELHVVVVEKRKDYTRDYPLRLNPLSFNDLPHHEELEALATEFKRKKIVPINEIEERLKALAEKVGIVFEQKTVDPTQLRKDYPQAKVFIGADGTHSNFREKIFNNEYRTNKGLQYLVRVKYLVEGTAKSFKKLLEGYPTLKAIETYAFESIGKQVNGQTPVTLQMFVGKEEYEALKDAKFGHGIKIENAPLTVRNIIKIWQGLKAENGKGVAVEGSEQITAIPLDTYVAKAVVKQEGDVTYLLSGNAAFGFPYFRSFNNGLLAGTRLAKAVTDSYSNPQYRLRSWGASSMSEGAVTEAFSDFASYVRGLTFVETRLAELRSLGLGLYIFYLKISNRVPWQNPALSWDKKDIKRLKNQVLPTSPEPSQTTLSAS